MLSFGKSKRIVNIAIDDYVIRMVENNGKDLSSIKIIQEKPIPQNIIERGKIIDELAFYDFMKEVVREWGIRNRKLRFYAPQNLVIMREIEIPENVKNDEIKQYITMEIGHTIHFPFQNPVFDIYEMPQLKHDENVTVFAAPEEEISKYTEIFADVHLTPVAVDAHALGVYRYFLKEEKQFTEEDVFLFLELNLTSANISIFSEHKIEFLRFQPLNISVSDWEADDEQQLRWVYRGDESKLQGEILDQINEIERLMNFYRYSLNQGEKSVTQIILLGDYPELDEIKESLQNRYEIPITTLNTRRLENTQISSVFIPVLGLALKGEV